MLDFALGRGRRHRAAGDRAAAEGMGRRLPLRLRLSHDGAGQDRARDPAAARRGGRGRAPHGQDVHHRHHAQPQGPHGRFRRHLGGAEGAGAGRRHRRDPRRGQRHRHAHVREADPRGPHRLREHGRGAQHPVGGSVVQPGDPAGRQYRGRGALHDAHLGGDRRRARSRRRAPRACRSTARPCTST